MSHAESFSYHDYLLRLRRDAYNHALCADSSVWNRFTIHGLIKSCNCLVRKSTRTAVSQKGHNVVMAVKFVLTRRASIHGVDTNVMSHRRSSRCVQRGVLPTQPLCRWPFSRGALFLTTSTNRPQPLVESVREEGIMMGNGEDIEKRRNMTKHYDSRIVSSCICMYLYVYVCRSWIRH